MKITPTMRRMVNDHEFYEIVGQLIQTQDRLREFENQHRNARRYDSEYSGGLRKVGVKAV